MDKRKAATAGAALAAVIAGGALTGAALPGLAAAGQVEAAAVAEHPAAGLERAETPSNGDDSAVVEPADSGSCRVHGEGGSSGRPPSRAPGTR